MRSSSGSSTDGGVTGIDQQKLLQTRAAARRAVSAAIRAPMEALEGRRLLSAKPFAVGNTPVFKASDSSINNVKSGPLAKGGGALVSIFREFQNFVKKGGVRSRFDSKLSDEYVVAGRYMGVTLRTRGSIDKLTDLVEANGGKVIIRSKSRKIAEAIIPIAAADNLAAVKDLMHIRPMVRTYTKSVGNGTNQAERAQKTDSVLEGFDVTGAGQKVGVISDSFDSPFLPPGLSILPGQTTGKTNGPYDAFSGRSDVSSGDLPDDVEIVTDANDFSFLTLDDTDDDGTATDPLFVSESNEGRAMLQLIHDIAPGAALAFASYGLTQLTFADAIRTLREDSAADVIVDDIGFSTEPFFQPGVIDRAIDDVTADGATYLTAAGNNGYAGYQRRADYIPDPDVKGGYIVDFDPGKGVDTKLDITIHQEGTLFMQWDNAYDGIVGDVRADMDFYLYRKDAAVEYSIDNNFATGIPVESFSVIEPGEYQIVMKVHSLAKGAELPSLYKFTAGGNSPGMFDARTDLEYIVDNTTISAPIGHSTTRSGISVGAVDYRFTEAYGQFKDFHSEAFSTAGTVLHAFDANGNRLDELLDLPGALISGVDGTQTTVLGDYLDPFSLTGVSTADFRQFYGTSAAAPNVAGLVLLLREMNPDISPEALRQALIDSAKQHPLNGTPAGTFDAQGGYGLVDGIYAASRLNSTVPTARIDVPASSSGVGSITVRFSEPVTGVDISDFLLTRDGTNVSRFRGNETVRDTGDGETYIIENLKSATLGLGTYTLRLRNSGTDIEDSGGHVALGQYISFDVTLRAPGDVKVDQLGDGKIRLRFTDTNSSEDDYRVERATNPSFSKNKATFKLGENATTFSDSKIEPATQYYYRIRAERGGRYGNPATVRVTNGSAGEIFIDQSDAKLSGSFTNKSDDAAWQESYASASGTGSLKTDSANTATFTANLKAGTYFAYVRYIARPSNATNTLVEVLGADGDVLYSQTLDQTKRGGGWVLLSDITNDKAGAVSIRLSSKGANGNIIADAVRFLPADAFE